MNSHNSLNNQFCFVAGFGEVWRMCVGRFFRRLGDALGRFNIPRVCSMMGVVVMSGCSGTRTKTDVKFGGEYSKWIRCARLKIDSKRSSLESMSLIAAKCLSRLKDLSRHVKSIFWRIRPWRGGICLRGARRALG